MKLRPAWSAAGRGIRKRDVEMRLYRGITVPAQTASHAIKEIRDNGLLPGKGGWTMIAADLKPMLKDLWELPAMG